MALIPFRLRSLIDDLTPSTIWDQDFGMGLLDDDLFQPRSLGLHLQPYFRPWRVLRGPESGMSTIVDDAKEFKVNIDVQQFKPDQINVKVVDKHVVITGQHEERQDEHGYISRQFQRRYLLPDNVDPAAVQSSLSSDGVLTIAAPKTQPAAVNERVVPIMQSNQPAAAAIKAPKKSQAKAEEKMDS